MDATPAAANNEGHPFGAARPLVLSVAVFVVAALCYANTVGGEFVFDDLKLIVNNDIVKDPGRIGELFVGNLWGLLGRDSNYYRPLPPLVFMALHAAFGMRPEPFHAVNILLHAGASTLLLLTIRALLEGAGVARARAAWPAFGAALLFAVHPVHTEAVAWISGVMDVSCTFFSLTAIYLYISADTHPRRPLRMALSCASLLLALFSKEPAAVVPLVLVACDVLFRRESLRPAASAVRRWGPAFAVLAGYLGLRAYALGGLAPMTHVEGHSTAEVLLTWPRLLALYLEKLLLPVGLNVVHHVEPVASAASGGFLFAILTIAAAAVVAWTAVRAGRLAALGVAVFVLTLAPSLYLPALGQDLAKAFAERYLYFPSAGAAMLLAAGLAGLATRAPALSRTVAVGVGVVAVAFATMTVSRNGVWRNSVTLWSDAVAKSPKLGMAHEGLGLALIRRGQQEEGRRELQAAARLSPELPKTSIHYGTLAAAKGSLLQAILYFQTALLYDPNLVEAHYDLALAFEQLGWTPSALQEYERTLSLAPGHADAHNNLGILLAQQGRVDEALGHFEDAVRARPADPELRINLARAYDMKGMAQQANEQRALAETGAGLAAAGAHRPARR